VSAAPPDFDDVREWVSFEDPDRTWLVDVTFLTSGWQCIWDQGCKGVHETPTPERAEGCCSHGAHFADDADVERVRRSASGLDPSQWQHHRDIAEAIVSDPDGQGEEATWTTALVDDACVFLNRPGFPGGHGCALHRGAVEAGVSYLDTKPEVCWQLPLRLEHHEDENGHLVSTLRPWRRHDWGDAGASFAWWCTDSHDAYIASTPVHERLRPEIGALVGPDILGRLEGYLARRRSGVAVAVPVRRSR
jgi:hypothetical protein